MGCTVGADIRERLVLVASFRFLCVCFLFCFFFAGFLFLALRQSGRDKTYLGLEKDDRSQPVCDRAVR